MTNPIAQAEQAHQAKRLPPPSRLGTLIVGWTLLLTLVLFMGEFIGKPLFDAPLTAADGLSVITLIPIIVALSLHFGFMLQTLQLGADSIAREYRNGTWELLLLTGIDARRLVVGKWWATVRAMLPSYIILAILRALVIPWLGASNSRHYTRVSFYDGTIIAPVPLDFLLSAGVVFALTMFNLLFTAACAVSVSASSEDNTIAALKAWLLRTVVLVAPVIFAQVLTDRLWFADQMGAFDVARLLTPAFVDNGLVIGSQLTAYYYEEVDAGLQAALLPAALIMCPFYILFTGLLLRLVEWQVIRQNAAPPLHPIRKT